MTRIKIKTLVWEEWNTEHIKKHKVTVAEVAEAGENLVLHRRTLKGRCLAIGRSGKRMLTLIIKKGGAGKYYLVTAFDTAKKDRRKVYEKENKK